MLYYLRVLESGAALPWSTCPYTPLKGRDRECAGIEEARRLSPLSFTVGTQHHYLHHPTTSTIPTTATTSTTPLLH